MNRWLVSRATRGRVVWGLLGTAAFGWAAAAAAVDAVRNPNVPSVVLALITGTLLLMVVTLAVQSVVAGMLRLDAAGYRQPLGVARAWRDVVALGRGRVDGRDAAVAAVRVPDGFGVTQDAFPGFAEDEADRVQDALAAHAEPSGLAGIEPGADWWASVEAEARRAASVVREATGREPLARERVDYGFRGLVHAVRLDYGTNDQGEGLELVVRESADLALTVHGRRWLRQVHRRGNDAAGELARLFEPHETRVVADPTSPFDRLEVRTGRGRPLRFNAEEPDRF